MLLQIFCQRQDIFAVLIRILHIVHRILYHKNAEAAFFAVLCRQRYVGIGICEGIVLLSAVDKGYLGGKRVFMQNDPIRHVAGLPVVGVIGDVYKQLLNGNVDTVFF